MIQNHLQVAVHRHLYELLKEKYPQHSNIISRMTHYMVTENDVREFTNLVGDLYECAYTKALKDYHSQLEAAGYKITLSYNTLNK